MTVSKTRRHLLGASAALAVAMTLFGAAAPAQAGALEDIKARGAIRIAVDIAHPPYGMLDDKAQQIGLDIDTAKALATDLGVKLEVVQVSGANRVPFLLSGKTDLVIASFSITEERKKVIAFSSPYGVIPVVVLGPKDSDVPDFKALDGQAIAVARGTTSDIELDRAQKETNGTAKIVRYEDEATATTAIQTGQQDYLAGALSTAQTVIKQNPQRNLDIKLELAAYPMAIGMRQNDPELEAWVNNWVSENLKNGRLNTIYESYFGQSLPAEMLAQ
ncbi:transporter substrate-binding domain-containing protein [Paracoccus sp. (in: a-proteobacteria)]|uniref:transporter substrate-binding domain-containing protein n=1 Tax=Paracoccus sp. TaxID=267 RepID=UPI00289E6C35|nr:transporter substrate-binding domain-containing protein [Paracoccus sp. (in: a-proteobacteria)]